MRRSASQMSFWESKGVESVRVSQVVKVAEGMEYRLSLCAGREEVQTEA